MLLQCWLATDWRCAVLQRLIEMRSDEAERTRGIRNKKEKKRADKEMARLQAQYVFASIACTRSLCIQLTPLLTHKLVLMHANTLLPCPGLLVHKDEAFQVLSSDANAWSLPDMCKGPGAKF